MLDRIDLHIHTNYSDGTKSPGEVLDIIRQKNLAAFSICDHDNLTGYFKIKELMGEGDPELIPGVELSAGKGNEDIHILGYYFNPDSEILHDSLKEFQKNRNRRGLEMLNKLKGLGIDLSFDLIKEIAGKSAIGRPNVADALLRIKAVKSFEEAFAKYIGSNGPAYVPKENSTPREAVELIHKAKGIAILAHPGIANAGRFINELLEFGLDGIEVYHPHHNSRLQETYLEFARQNSILVTGGSDYHGRNGRYADIGSQPVSIKLWIAMKEKMKIE